MICGGSAEVLITYVPSADPALLEVCRAARAAEKAQRRAWLFTIQPAAAGDAGGAGDVDGNAVEYCLLGDDDSVAGAQACDPGALRSAVGKIAVHGSTKLPDGRTVLVEDFGGNYYTQVKTDKNVLIAGQAGMRALPGATLFFGELEVTEQVIAYQKRDLTDQHIIDTTTLDLPEQTYTTQAFWLAIPGQTVEAALAALANAARPVQPVVPGATDESATPGSLHAAEHALIALLPLYAMCDRWDIGGLSTPWHWQTDTASIFVYDGYPGGIGLAKRGFDAFESLAADARSLIAECPCESGCPSCVQSPKCGNLNEPLNKAGAVALLDAISHTPASAPQADPDSRETP
jgi:DEAD/DEAH box helicase domain-containing protein